MTVIISGIVVAIVLVSFSAGVLYEMNKKDERMSARVIRPANITIERNIHITEYNVVNEEALDLDFPKVECER